MPPNPRTDEACIYAGEEEGVMDVDGRYGENPEGVLNGDIIVRVMLANVRGIPLDGRRNEHKSIFEFMKDF